MCDVDPESSGGTRRSQPSGTASLLFATFNASQNKSSRHYNYLRPPRLGIIHLLAWITFGVVLMKFDLGMDILNPPLEGQSPAHLVLRHCRQAGKSIFEAAALVGAGILVLTKRRSRSGNFQPGHWILLINSAIIVLRCFILFVAYVLLQHEQLVQVPIKAALSMIIAISGACALIPAWRRLPESGRWKVYFKSLCAYWVLLGITFLLVACGSRLYLAFLAVFFCGCVVTGAFLVAVVVDLKTRSNRDWVHWLGVAYVIASSILLVADSIATVFLRIKAPIGG
jgi:hypothetical protein